MALGHPLRPVVHAGELVGAGGSSNETLSTALDHGFSRPSLLEEALTHRSADAHQKGERQSYERLEFLGDRVLSLVVADTLMARFPRETEGDLSRRHASLVRRDALARVAAAIGLGPHLRLSKSEDGAAGRRNPAILADACEAVIGALYLDGGLEVAAKFVTAHWTAMMEEAPNPPQDAKTALQEWAQGQGRPLPAYRTLAQEGPAHEPHFEVEVKVEGEAPARGSGPSKRAAEQVAAGALLDRIEPGRGG